MPRADYYCTYCFGGHRASSKLGIEHKKYAGVWSPVKKTEYVIWGAWEEGEPDYECTPIIEGKLAQDGAYGGPGHRLKDCKNWLREKHPRGRIYYVKAGNEWNVDVLEVRPLESTMKGGE